MANELKAIVGADISGLEKGLSDAISKLTDFEKKVSKIAGVSEQLKGIGKSLSVGVTAPIVAMGTAAFMASNQVENAFSSLRRATGATGDEAIALEKSFKDVFKGVPESARAVSDVMGALSTATDATGKELEKLSKITLDYARVNNQDAAESASSLGRIMNALELDIAELPGLMDTLTKASQMSGISVNQLTELVTQAGPAFDEMGFGLERAIGLFASFHKAGANPNEVLSSMNKVLITLSESGIKDTELAFQSLLDEIKDAPTLIDGVTIAAEAFGSRVGGNIADDIRAGRFEVEEWVEALKSSQGIVTETAAATMTFGEQMGVLRNRITVALEPFGKELKVALAGVMNALNPVIKGVEDLSVGFSNLSPQTKKIIIGIGAAAAAVGPLMVGVGALGAALPAIISGVGALGTAFTLLTGPIGLVAVAIGAAAVAIVKNWATVKQAIEDGINWFIDLYNESLLVRAGVEAMAVQFKVGFAAISNTLSTAWEVIKSVFGGIVNSAKALGQVLKGALTFDFDLMKSGVEAFGGAVTGTFTDIFEDVKDGAKKHISEVADIIQNSAERILAGKIGEFKFSASNVEVEIEDATLTKESDKAIEEAVRSGVHRATAIEALPVEINISEIKFNLPKVKLPIAEMIEIDQDAVFERLFPLHHALVQNAEMLSDTIVGGLADVAMDSIFALADSLASGANVLESAGAVLLSGISNVAMQVGKMAVGIGIGLLSIQEALKTLGPYGAIAAGVALIALAGVFSSMSKSIGGSMGSGGGGGASPSPAAASTGSFAAPSRSSASGSQDFRFIIAGSDLVTVTDRARQRMDRIG